VTGLTNETIGNYRVVQQLGEGGMGVVCLAQHPVIGRKVAIKLLHPALASHPDVVTRFFNEARAIHAVGHENVVEILDFGETDAGQPYFIMEFLEGEPLSDAVARGAMDPERVMLIADQMCRALSATHAKGIIHRDLKPQNVQLCGKPDGGLQVKVLDFGVAKILPSPDGAQSAKTRTGSLMGTPLYMSPEQCRGAGAIDARADIYSLGVMLFEMLVGRPPFVAEGLGELFTMHMFDPPPSLADLAPHVPRHMAAAIGKALAKEPADRFQSMDDFRDALTGVLELALPEPPRPPRASRGLSGATKAGGDRSAAASRKWGALAASIALAATIGFQLLSKGQSRAATSIARRAPPAVLPARPAAAPAPATTPTVAPHDAPEALPSAARKPPIRRHAKKPALQIDLDGLAKPSF
jgi:serine/threonine-protein kinase